MSKKPKKTQQNSTVVTVSEAIQQIIKTPQFYEWCKGAFWGLLTDQVDLESKIKFLLEIDDFASLNTNEKAVKTFELFLGRPFTAWLEKRTAAAHSMYQTPVPFIDERQLKIDVINAGINEQMAQMIAR